MKGDGSCPKECRGHAGKKKGRTLGRMKREKIKKEMKGKKETKTEHHDKFPLFVICAR